MRKFQKKVEYLKKYCARFAEKLNKPYRNFEKIFVKFLENFGILITKVWMQFVVIFEEMSEKILESLEYMASGQSVVLQYDYRMEDFHLISYHPKIFYLVSSAFSLERKTQPDNGFTSVHDSYSTYYVEIGSSLETYPNFSL